MTRYRFSVLAPIIGLFGLVLGCGGMEESVDEVFEQAGSPLMAGNGLMWETSRYQPVVLDVCWLNPGAASATRREWARQAIKSSWERYARVIFVGWDRCQDEANAITPPHTHGPRRPGLGDENVKVQITSSGGSQNPGHGSYGDHQSPGVLLNLSGTRADIEFLAIHEFGHVVGFYHEEERDDWPTNIPNCPKQTHNSNSVWWPVPGEIQYGDVDRHSVMAYCSGRPTELTPHDIAGVQRAYGRRKRGTVISARGALCLSSHVLQADGEAAFMWECDEPSYDQSWYYDPVRSALYANAPIDLGASMRRCLDVDTNDYRNVQLWSCHYGANQQWHFRRVAIRGYGGQCLTRSAWGIGLVTMRPCNGTAAQQWRVEKGRVGNTVKLRAETGDVCLSATGTDGNRVRARHCDGGRDLDFTLYRGAIKPARLYNKCIDVRDVWDSEYLDGSGGPSTGQAVQLFTCHRSQLNQQWNLSGDIRSGGKCLARAANSLRHGWRAVVATCDDSLDQDWDYYW